MTWLRCTLLAAWLIPAVLAGAAAPDPSQLAPVLGPDAATWTIVPPNYTVVATNGQTVLQTQPGGVVTLTSSNRHGGPLEYRFSFRLDPQPGQPAAIYCMVGCATRADKRAQSFGVSVYAPPDVDYLSYGCTVQPDHPRPVSGTLYVRAITDRSLAWPAVVRKTVEAANAHPPAVKDLVQTIRLVIANGKFTAFYNERFIDEVPLGKEVDPTGTITISLTHQVQLLSVRLAPAAPVAGRFAPLGLGGLFNATALVNGQRVTQTGLAGPDQTALVDGVAFRFAAPDARGNDHLDLGPSWVPFGSLPGYFMAYTGPFGGRWTSADKPDPTRFATYVPAGQYKALHLIAAADGEKDSIPVVSAQFYRPGAGHPVTFSGAVPLFTAKAGGAAAFPAKLANGKQGQLHHVVVPLDPDGFSWFADLPRIALELTKAVQPYRAYPDPLEYSWHAAGLPSGVHIYAATLERAAVEVDLQPDQVAHVWTAPAMPSYTIHLRNRTGAATTAKLTVGTISYDGVETNTAADRTITLATEDADVPVQVPLSPKRYGLHRLVVTCAVGADTYIYRRNLAYLHADTRERGNWAEGKGALFGYNGWGGGHDTPGPKVDITVMGQAGAETALGQYGTNPDPEVRALAAKYQIINEDAFEPYAMYNLAFSAAFTAAMPSKWHPEDPAGTGRALVEQLRKIQVAPGPLNKPTYLPFFPEPIVAERLPSGIWPHHYNGPAYRFTKADEDLYQYYLQRFLIGAPAVRKEWPNVKILFPYGDPMNTAIFLERSPETRGLIDGIAIDIPGFERLPEQQINQVVLNRLYPILQDVKKYLKNPLLVMVEGPCVSGKDEDTTEEEKGDIGIRNFLVLLGYGITRHPSANSSFECAGWWGENHYGGGYLSRKPLAMPEIGYVGYATLTRHLNRANHVKYIPTGSTSVFCQQFKHYQTGALVRVLWTVRGTRPVTVQVPVGAKVAVYDENDNELPLQVAGDAATFTIDQSPCYLEGLPADAAITLGEPDHRDAAPGAFARKLANLGSDGWKLVAKRDREYEDTNHLQIERFLGNMSARTVDAPAGQGGKALAVHLGAQEIDRRVMPYYTTFAPRGAVVIPGKASHLGLWVRAASDWGRVVYCLRDAQGERWISVGTKEDWNCDDIHAWSAFAFDGWRYVRFELPASAPWDSYRELGTTWWGSYGGDRIVDLPLKLEKIIVERRSSVIYGAELVPAKPDDVLLGDLFAEYATAADQTPEAVRLAALRMPVPAGEPALDNPVANLAKTGVGAPTKLLKVRDPAQQYDGTRCHVEFVPVAGATKYDVWVSPYPDGRGAVQLGAGWKESGQLLEGLAPDTDFYVFVVHTDGGGKLSKPSRPLKIHLTNRSVYQ